jgi:hypothetical protein
MFCNCRFFLNRFVGELWNEGESAQIKKNLRRIRQAGYSRKRRNLRLTSCGSVKYLWNDSSPNYIAFGAVFLELRAVFVLNFTLRKLQQKPGEHNIDGSSCLLKFHLDLMICFERNYNINRTRFLLLLITLLFNNVIVIMHKNHEFVQFLSDWIAPKLLCARQRDTRPFSILFF